MRTPQRNAIPSDDGLGWRVGCLTVLSQAFRSIIYSRMRTGMGRYDREFPKADVVLFEPRRDDADMFFANVFSYSDRKRLSEHAYQTTRAELRRRYDRAAPESLPGMA